MSSTESSKARSNKTSTYITSNTHRYWRSMISSTEMSLQTSISTMLSLSTSTVLTTTALSTHQITSTDTSTNAGRQLRHTAGTEIVFVSFCCAMVVLFLW
jgi:hypothetical protein